MKEVLDPKNFIGFAPIQTEEFIANEVQPILESIEMAFDRSNQLGFSMKEPPQNVPVNNTIDPNQSRKPAFKKMSFGMKG